MIIPKIYEYAAIAICALLLLSGIYLRGRHDGVEHEQAENQIAIAEAEQTKARTEAADRAERDKRESSYLERIRQLEGPVSAPVLSQPVRLCDPRGSVSRPTQAASSANAASPSGEPTVQASEDLGPTLRDYGKTCESLRIQLDELQQWAASL